jgi:putative transcriptional regulator
VPLSWHTRLVLAVAAIFLPATLINAARPNVEPGPEHTSLAGQLLIASPEMGDPRFARTVILLVQHNQRGAFGIVINRPVGERPLASVLDGLGEKNTGLEGSVRIFAGGPVQPELGFVLHTAEYRRAETTEIDGRVAMTSSLEIIRDIGGNKGPKKSLLAFGYAGWAPGQLEGELKLGAWFTAPADLKLVFDDDRETVWENAMARRPRDI